MDAVGDRMFLENNPFEAVQGRTDLNALEKLPGGHPPEPERPDTHPLDGAGHPPHLQPRVLLGMIEANRRILTPYYQALLEEGNRDGSLRTDYPRELAELLPPPHQPVAAALGIPRHQGGDEAKVPVSGGDAGGDGGVPLFDESIREVVGQFFDQIPEDLCPQTPK